MANENEQLNQTHKYGKDSFSFDDLEKTLESQLLNEFNDIDFLEDELDKIGDTDKLGEAIENVVWEQFINLIADKAGEDFIEENRGLLLDLREGAHIQTLEAFKKGDFATHNTEIDYKSRSESWESKFEHDDDGIRKTNYDKRTKKEKEVLTQEAREKFDKERQKGSASMHMDHTVPVAEIIRNPEMAAFVSEEKQINFASDPNVNLNPLVAAANQSKGDLTMSEWLESERDGLKPADRFPIDAEELKQRDLLAREEMEDIIEEGKNEAVTTGRKSRRREASNVAKKVGRAAAMTLLAEFMRDIISELVKWFKTAEKNMDTLLASIKTAFERFCSKWEKNLAIAVDVSVSAFLYAVWGPVVGVIRKVWLLLKQGYKSLKEAIEYIKNPDNKEKSFDEMVFEVGKIVIAGLTVAGSVVLSEVIETGLMTIPVFAIEIPLLGSMANVLGIFMGAVTSGIIGAIAINLIQKTLDKRRETSINKAMSDKKMEILATQGALIEVHDIKTERLKDEAFEIIDERHKDAAEKTEKILENIFSEDFETQLDKNDNIIKELMEDI